MEKYLFYSYRKLCHSERKHLRTVLKSIPWWMWLTIGLCFAGFVLGVATHHSFAGATWRKVVMLLSLCLLGLVVMGIDNIKISYSEDRLTEYWKHIELVRTLLRKTGINNTEDIEVLRVRVRMRLDEEKKNLTELVAHDQRWLQTFAIPAILAIITAFLSQELDVYERLSNILTVLIVFVITL